MKESSSPTTRRGWGGAGATAGLLAPAALLLLVGFAYPLLKTINLSFTEGLDDYVWVISDSFNQHVIKQTVMTAIVVTVTCVIISYPYAYYMTIASKRVRLLLWVIVLLPFWTNALVRLFSWLVILQPEGILDRMLAVFGIPEAEILGTMPAVVLTMAQMLLPFCLLPMYATMSKIDPRTLAAASSLGARGLRAWRTVHLPLALPGVMAGAVTTCILSLGFYLTPLLMGSPRNTMISVLIQQQVVTTGDLPKGAALGVTLLVGSIVSIAVVRLLLIPVTRWQGRQG
ncbi:ABC transporter permease subunit [Aeromicrobium sp. 636]|uniref:ABC transporter permease n=1 Tax=Aeromicrobium senzhongii TaxID=2663859 RepID=A0A8I0ET37_9ACTN|nr:MULTISPECIES: ABC transporter permease [Aeromicrobium]MBC9225123.1 ABC transporter permease [Aeromicrobium senzhongii]MCQ3997233.1 ABC transporter permease subunit [Aeromicrobium sp. 636]